MTDISKILARLTDDQILQAVQRARRGLQEPELTIDLGRGEERNFRSQRSARRFLKRHPRSFRPNFLTILDPYMDQWLVVETTSGGEAVRGRFTTEAEAEAHAANLLAEARKAAPNPLPIEDIGGGRSALPPWEAPAKRPARSPWKWACPCGARFRSQDELIRHIGVNQCSSTQSSTSSSTS